MRFTINLLPSEKQQALRAGLVITYVENILLSFLILACIFAVTLVSLRFVLRGFHDDLAGRADEISTESGSTRAEIRNIDAYLKRVDAVQRQAIAWSDVFVGLAEATPSGIRLAGIDVTPKGKVSVRGMAPTRDHVLRYNDALEASGLFSSISSPLSNILQRTDVQFTFEATYQPLVDLGL